MGDMLVATCPCGYESDMLFVGCGMEVYAGIAPALCRHCRKYVTVDPSKLRLHCPTPVAMVSDTLAVIVPAPDVDQTTWKSIALVGFADDGWVQEFLAGLPPPVGLNSRGRRAIRRWPLSFGSSPRVPSR